MARSVSASAFSFRRTKYPLRCRERHCDALNYHVQRRAYNSAPTGRLLLLVVWLWLFRPSHLLRETGGVFLVLRAVDRELAQHVIRIFPGPILVRIIVSHLCGAALLILMMDRICARRIHHLGRAAKTALQQMTAKSPVLTEADLVVFAFGLAGDRDIAGLGLLGSAGHHHYVGDRFERFALIGISFLVDVVIREIPISERAHHRFARWALRHVGDREAVQLHFTVGSFFDEEHLPAAASHLCRFGIKPAWTCRVTRTGLLQLPGDFPRRFTFGFFRRATDGNSQEKACHQHRNQRDE